MMLDSVDRRVLGAVRFLDATTQLAIRHGLRVRAADASLLVNRSGLWVIWKAKGLEGHSTVFEAPPAAPALASVSVDLIVDDSEARYLARRATVKLPRDPALATATQVNSLFRPQDVRMYPAPNAATSPGWALVRAHVARASGGAPLAGALVRVLRPADQQVLARGMSDSRGEALVAVPGIPVTSFSSGDGPPIATEIDVTVQAIFDPAAGADPDPDAIESASGLPATSSAQKLAARQQLAVSLTIAVP